MFISLMLTEKIGFSIHLQTNHTRCSWCSMKTNKTLILAALIFLAGLLLTIFALLTPNAMRGASSGMMGVSTDIDSYSITSMLLAIVGSFVMAIGAFMAIFKQEYEPLIDLPAIRSPGIPVMGPVEPVQPQMEKTVRPVEGPADIPLEVKPIDDRILVLRLLSGDERALFRAIVESEGETLQKDLITKTKMSDAKVSRTLDKLVEKGVVSKMRHGMTNKVRVEIEP